MSAGRANCAVSVAAVQKSVSGDLRRGPVRANNTHAGQQGGAAAMAPTAESSQPDRSQFTSECESRGVMYWGASAGRRSLSRLRGHFDDLEIGRQLLALGLRSEQ